MIASTRLLARSLKTAAYRIGRRYSLARRIVASLRRVRRPSGDLIKHELVALTEFLRNSGCTFHDCASLGSDPKRLGISFRYDVHVRDIAACHTFIETHRAIRIPATFFLFWDYSRLEHDYGGSFRRLATKLTSPLSLGLHDSPVDAYLIQSRFGLDRGAYWRWLNSESATSWVTSLAEDQDHLMEFNNAVLQSFVARVRLTQERFGRVSMVACHGGDMLQTWRGNLDQLDPQIAQTVRGFFARSWLTPDRVAAAGLYASVDDFGRSGAKWRQVSDCGGAICQMVQSIQNLSLNRAMAVQILLHPYTWDAAVRDGEVSDLLKGSLIASRANDINQRPDIVIG